MIYHDMSEFNGNRPDERDRTSTEGIHITLNVTTINHYHSSNQQRIEPTTKPNQKRVHPYISDLYDHEFLQINERDPNQSKIVRSEQPNELLQALQILAKFLQQ